MKKNLPFLLFLLVPFQMAYAQEISFLVDQSEYYFTVGEDALIPLNVENSFGRQISGILQYTVMQQINQGNVQFSNSKTNANTFVVEDGNQVVSLNFGTSENPATFMVNLSFNYNEGNDQTVSLGPITIHFVMDESQKNNQPNQLQSSIQNTPPNQQGTFSQQRQQMQQRLDQLLGNQQTLPQDPQQRLQNNQMSQDSTALKQQIQKQMQEQEQTQKEFEKQLSFSPEFASQHKQLLENGYNVTGGNIKPTSNNTGDFDIQYNNEDGKWARLQGKMENGTITEIKQQTQEQQEKLLEKLEQNTQYKEFKTQLTQSGFSQNDLKFNYAGNETSIVIEYHNQNKESASITGVFENEQIKNVILDIDNSNMIDSLLLTMIIVSVLVALIAGFFLIKKFSKKKLVKEINTQKIKMSKQFDYVTESKKLILKAKQSYDQEEYKNAFGMAGQAIRLFLSHDIGQKKELTNDELTQLLSKEKYPVDEIIQCLKITELVEFAKAKHSEDDFKKIVSLFEKLM